MGASGVQLSDAWLPQINGFYAKVENDTLPESFKYKKWAVYTPEDWADYTQGMPWYKQEEPDNGCFFFWNTYASQWILRDSKKENSQDLYGIRDDKTAPDFDKVVTVMQGWRHYPRKTLPDVELKH